mgnify:CR=1 FL=1
MLSGVERVRELATLSRMRHAHPCLLLTLLAVLPACGDAGATSDQPLDETLNTAIHDAASGDAESMRNLEDQAGNSARDFVKNTEAAAAKGDPAAQVIQAQLEGGYDAVLALAEDGHALAMLEYGRYCNAHPDEATRKEGADWIVRAANEGEADARFVAGKHTYNGLPGFNKDVEQGRIWLESAANAGHGESAYALATYARYGIGTDVDRGAAIEWMRKADAAGFEAAKADLESLLAE